MLKTVLWGRFLAQNLNSFDVVTSGRMDACQKEDVEVPPLLF